MAAMSLELVFQYLVSPVYYPRRRDDAAVDGLSLFFGCSSGSCSR